MDICFQAVIHGGLAEMEKVTSATYRRREIFRSNMFCSSLNSATSQRQMSISETRNFWDVCRVVPQARAPSPPQGQGGRVLMG